MSADDPFDVEELLEAPYKKQEDNGDSHQDSGSNDEYSSRSNKSHKKKRRHRHNDDEGSDRESSKRDRDRRRSRSRDRHDSSRSHRGRDRDRDSYRDREDDRRRDRDRDDDRRRDRDRDDDRRRDRDRDRDRDRGRSDRHSYRDRDQDRQGDSDGDKRQERMRSRRELLKEAETLTPEERDIRTVFCMQLAKGIRSDDLADFFAPAGTVVDVRLIADRNSRRSKGIAYVEFLTPDSLPRAIGMTGQRVKGVPIVVQATQSEKNRLAAAAQTLQKPAGACRLYVSNLHPNIDDDMINAIFTPFGQIESCKVQKNESGESKSYAYVQFKTADSAKQAIDHLHGFELVGRPIKVTFSVEDTGGSDPSTSLDVSRAAMMAKLAANPAAMMPAASVAPVAMTGSLLANPLAAVAGLGATGLGATGLGATGLGATNLGGLGLAGIAGLGATGLGLPATAAGLVSAPVAPAAPSPCFNLQNMFDPANETDDDWQQEIIDDVLDEATKFGDVIHIHVDDKSPQGLVYVKCRDGNVAVNAMKSLHGRFFAGKQIIATQIPEFQYHTLFANAAGAFTAIKPSR